MALAQAVILEKVEIDNPPYSYVEDTVNVDEDGEGMLYSVVEFVELFETKKLTLVSAPAVVKALLAYLKSGDMDQDRDVTHLAKAYNLAHGLEKG